MSRKRNKDFIGKAVGSKTAMGKKKSRVLLYRGHQPTKFEMAAKRFSRNPVIVIDETGSMASLESDKDDKRKSFTVVGTLVSDSARFKETRKKFPDVYGEAKYSNTTLLEGEPIFEDLSVQDFVFSEIHRSRRNECFQTKKKRVNAYKEMVSRMMEIHDPGTPHNIIIDSPPVDAVDDLVKVCKERLDKGSDIEWFEVRPSVEDHILQVHDFVTGAVGDNIEGVSGKEKLYRMIEDKKKAL